MAFRAPVRLAALTLGLAFLAATLVAMERELQAQPLLRTAGAVERSAALPVASDGLRRRLERDLDTGAACWERKGSERVTTALFLLRLAEADDGTLAERVDLARRVVRETLACDPLDGQSWVAAADLARRYPDAQGDPRAYLAASIASAPYEGAALAERAVLMIASARELSVASDLVLRSDLLNAVRYFPPFAAARLLGTMTQGGEASLAAEFDAALPPERRAAMDQAVERERRRQERLRGPEQHPSLRSPSLVP